MKRLRLAFLVVGAVLLCLFMTVAAYDFNAFQSHKHEINAVIASASGDEQALTPSMRRLLQIAVLHQLPQNAARILIVKLNVPRVAEGSNGRVLTILLWWGLAAIHLTEQEQFALLASQSHMNEGRIGISAESMARFGKPPSALSFDEEFTVASLVFSPYVEQRPRDLEPERIERRRKWLLQRYENGS